MRKRDFWSKCVLVMGISTVLVMSIAFFRAQAIASVEEKVTAQVMQSTPLTENVENVTNVSEIREASTLLNSQSVPMAEQLEQIEEETVALEETVPEEYAVEILDQTHLNSAKELCFNDYQIDDIEGFVEALIPFYQLERVEMCNTNLSDEIMGNLCEIFPNTKFVWVVHCAGFDVRTDAVAFSTMFTGYGRDPYTEADFDVLKYCTDLEALDIGHHSIKDISFIKDLKKLKILIIAINRIEDLKPLENLTDITYLELFLNSIVDLSPLEKLVNIEHLNLCHNKNLGEIEPILHYTNLQRLWISYCNLTNEEKERIREAYPNAKLEFDVYESVEAGWRSTDVYTRMRGVFNNNQMDEMFLPKVAPMGEDNDL